jgi:hypothetical protein
MPRGSLLGTERIDRRDADTGLLVRQITSFPTPSNHMHYETPTFTPDGKRMIFLSMRIPERGAPNDLFTVGSDGKEIFQLSDDTPSGVSSPTLSVDGGHVFYMHGGTAYRTSIDATETVELGNIPGASQHGYPRAMVSWDGRWYFAMAKLQNGRVGLVRWDTASGNHVVAFETNGINHPRANPGGPEVDCSIKTRHKDGSLSAKSLRFHCATLEEIASKLPLGGFQTAHACWLGKTGDYHGTLQMPHRGVMVMRRDAAEPDMIAYGGPYFWHSGASFDGEWIVADTNWPDEGLWLLNVKTKKRERLCFTGASQGHPQSTHPHANLSHDASMAVYTSDRTGMPQVYVVYVPEEMKDRLASTR